MPSRKKGWWQGRVRGKVEEVGDSARVTLEDVGWSKVKREERIDLRNAAIQGSRLSGEEIRAWRLSLGLGRPLFSDLVGFSERRLIEVEEGAKYKVRFLKSLQRLAQAIADESELLLAAFRTYATLPVTFQNEIPINRLGAKGRWLQCLCPDCRKWFYALNEQAQYCSNRCRVAGYTKYGIRVHPGRRTVGERTVECPNCQHHFDYRSGLLHTKRQSPWQAQNDEARPVGTTGDRPEVLQLLRRTESRLQSSGEVPEGDDPDSNG